MIGVDYKDAGGELKSIRVEANSSCPAVTVTGIEEYLGPAIVLDLLNLGEVKVRVIVRTLGEAGESYLTNAALAKMFA